MTLFDDPKPEEFSTDEALNAISEPAESNSLLNGEPLDAEPEVLEVEPEATEPEPEPEPEEPVEEGPSASDLLAETEHLKTRIAALEIENALLRSKLPANITAREGYKVIYLKSNGVLTETKEDGKKYVKGDINGDKFEVVCDEQTEVREDIAGALKGLLDSQKG